MTFKSYNTPVELKADFKNATKTIIGRNINENCYAVWSYGEHFPLYINKDNCWYGNSDGYSRTTSRHRTTCMPGNKESITWVDTQAMKALLR